MACDSPIKGPACPGTRWLRSSAPSRTRRRGDCWPRRVATMESVSVDACTDGSRAAAADRCADRGAVQRSAGSGDVDVWRARRDSNSRPPAPQAGALSTELRAPRIAEEPRERSGGEGGIRTLDAGYPTWRFSNSHTACPRTSSDVRLSVDDGLGARHSSARVCHRPPVRASDWASGIVREPQLTYRQPSDATRRSGR